MTNPGANQAIVVNLIDLGAEPLLLRSLIADHHCATDPQVLAEYLAFRCAPPPHYDASADTATSRACGMPASTDCPGWTALSS